MIELLKKIYHKLSKFKIVRMLGEVYENGFPLGNYKAYLRLKKLKKQAKHEGKIKVVFLVQYAQVWNKLETVYERMLEDERFEAKLLAVPEKITDIDKKIYEHFYNIYGDKVIDTYHNGHWFDLKGYKPDYVFYQRPYDQYLPEEYRSGVVSEYARVCHVPYGYQVMRTTEHSAMNKLFFRNAYIYFAENTIYYEKNRNRFKKSHREGVRKTLNIGYPALEKFLQKKCDKDNEYFNVLWTPRWTEDKDSGGSNFINFKDQVLELPRENKNIFLMFRPHPMTFDHFVSVGRITQQEVDAYKQVYEENDRMHYDNSAAYEEMFWKSDVLLTDASTIIVEYFLTGKPVVYCDTGAKPNAFLEELTKVFYVVKTWEEAKRVVLELANGIDPLREKREQKRKELMGNDLEHISKRFLDEIYSDYNS